MGLLQKEDSNFTSDTPETILSHNSAYKLTKTTELPIFKDHQGARPNNVSFPSVDEFAPKYMDELQEYVILDRRTSTSHRGDVDYL